MQPDIAKEIRDQIEQLRERNFIPAFILLGHRSYSLLCDYTKALDRALGMPASERPILVTEFDNIPVVFNPDAHEFYVKVLPDSEISFLYLQKQSDHS